jgi:hypothetical protein
MELGRLSRDHPDLRGINQIQRIVIVKDLMKQSRPGEEVSEELRSQRSTR